MIADATERTLPSNILFGLLKVSLLDLCLFATMSDTISAPHVQSMLLLCSGHLSISAKPEVAHC
jgi:hypothetical protein